MENDNVAKKSKFKFVSKSLIKGAAAIAAGTVIGVVLTNRLGNANDKS